MPKCPVCPNNVDQLETETCLQCGRSMKSCGTHLLPVCLDCEQLNHNMTTCANAVWPVSSAFSPVVPCSTAAQAAGGGTGSHPESLTRISQLERMFLEEEQDRLRHLLEGAKFEVNKGRLARSAFKLKKRATKVSKKAAAAGEAAGAPAAEAAGKATASAKEQARQLLEGLIPEIFDESLPALRANLPEIFEIALPEALEAVAAAAAQTAPLVGTGMSAAKMVGSAISSVKQSTAAVRGRIHAAHFADGPPREAADAVQRTEARKANASAVKSGIGAVAMAGHAPADAAAIASLAGTPFSFGASAAFLIPTTIAGAMTAFARALVSFIYMLHLMARDYRETKRVNQLMARGGPLDERLFEVCPLLGAAYLVETDPRRTQQLVRLPSTFVDSACAGHPEASGLLAAAAKASKRFLRVQPKSFREQVSDDLENHIEPTVATARKQLRKYGWVLTGPNVKVANQPELLAAPMPAQRAAAP